MIFCQLADGQMLACSCSSPHALIKQVMYSYLAYYKCTPINQILRYYVSKPMVFICQPGQPLAL